MGGISIETVDVFKKLGPNQALDGVAMTFESGTLHTLLGPNGAGKTTLLRTLAGLLKPDAGRVLFRRDGVERPFDAVRPGIAYMPQQRSLYDELTISEHLAFFAKLYDISRKEYLKRRGDLLALTKLDRFAQRQVGKLSGGMYNMVGLMCALLPAPEVLLLDEPTNGLDPVSRREFWELLHALAEQAAATIIMSTSYMDEGERSARIHLIDRGRRLAEGEPHVVLRAEQVRTLAEIFLRREAAHR